MPLLGLSWLDPYADPETYLLDRATWAGLRAEYCQAVERPIAGDERVAHLGRDLGEELGSFASMLERGDGPVRTIPITPPRRPSVPGTTRANGHRPRYSHLLAICYRTPSW
jgi:hypothetical protein